MVGWSASDEQWKDAKSRRIREIGPLAAIKTPERRARCKKSALAFAKTYFPKWCTSEFSADHRDVYKKAQETIIRKGRFAYAMSRGMGKSTTMKILVLWAVLYDYACYVLIITAEKTLAYDFLADIAGEIQDNALLLEDFPELKCFVALEGEPRKQGGQMVDGVKTRLFLSPGMIRFPSFPNNPSVQSSEAIIEARSITASLRGRTKRIRRRIQRPDFTILDDIQTDESAASPVQVAKNLRIIRTSVLGLAGAGKAMATFFIGTVITKGDVTDTLLDHTLSPEWRGKKCKMLYSLPVHLDWWETEYLDVRNQSLLERGDMKLANAFYRKHKKYATEGMQVSWNGFHDRKRFVDSMQFAMEKYLENKEAFWSECQNEPMVDDSITQAIRLTGINFTRLPHRTVPNWATGLYLGVDVGKYLAYYTVVATAPDFTTAVVDYGTYPRQDKTDFTYGDKYVKTWVNPAYGENDNIANGILHLLQMVENTTWVREDGKHMQISGGLIDGGYKGSDTVVPVLLMPEYEGRYFTVFGKFPGVLATQFSEYVPKRNESIGHNLVQVDATLKRMDGEQKIEVPYTYIRQYVNEWKTQLSQMVGITPGNPGSFRLWGDDIERHRMYFRHISSEYPTPVTGRGITIDVWKKIPNAENHLLDSTIYALGAASIGGCKWGKTLDFVPIPDPSPIQVVP